jgi:hypothetical protein
VLASTAAGCRCCGAPTRLFAFALAAGHWVLEPDDGAEDDAETADAWRVSGDIAFLFHVEWVDERVERCVRQVATSFRPDDRGWLNHCDVCGSPQPEDDLHCEPGGAFLPITAEDARRIRRMSIDAPFEAVAAGYSPDPPFFDAMG